MYMYIHVCICICICVYIYIYIYKQFFKSFKLGSHQAILFWREKLKLLPLLFPGNSDFFEAIFLYRLIHFYRQLIPTKLILSPNLKEKILSSKQRDGMQTFCTLFGEHFFFIVPKLFYYFTFF